jgi:hypothetical protein
VSIAVSNPLPDISLAMSAEFPAIAAEYSAIVCSQEFDSAIALTTGERSDETVSVASRTGWYRSVGIYRAD